MIPDIALDQCLCFIMEQYKMKVNEIVVSCLGLKLWDQ